MRMSNLGRNLAVVDRPISEFANENFFLFVYDNKILWIFSAGGYAYNQCKEAYFLIVAET